MLKWRIAVMLALWALSSCALAAPEPEHSLSYLESTGRYEELVAEGHARLERGAERNTTLLGPLCIGYGKLKRYRELFSCVEDLEARIAGGDDRMAPDYPGFNGAFMRPANARPLPGMLRAEAFVELGEYEKALAAVKQTLPLLGERPGPSMTEIWAPLRYHLNLLSTQALAGALAGDRERALQLIRELDEVGTPFLGVALWKPMKTIGLARAYIAVGAYDKALAEIEALGSNFRFVWALGSAFDVTGSRGDSLRNLTEVARLVMLGKCFVELGRTDEARTALDQVLAMPRLKDSGDLHWVALYERARIAEKQAAPENAIGLYAHAVDIIEAQRSSIGSEANKIGFVGNKQAVYGRLVRLLVVQDHAVEAFQYVERSKARALVDLLASKKEFAASSADPEAERRILAELDAASETARLQTASFSDTESATRSLQLVTTGIRQAAPELSTLVTVTSVPSDELKALVGEAEALVEYYYDAGELYAFILKRDALAATRLDAVGLAQDVQSFRAALQDVRSEAWQESATALHRRLWRPLEATLGVNNVIIVPHGALHYLPFSALRGVEGKLLIDQYSVRFLPSASVLKFLKPSASPKNALLLALGNPDLGDSALDLKFAENEARTVANLFPQSRVLVRKDASETNFKAAGAVFSRIHFATHGKFQAEDPLNSGLFLAKDASNDGLLTVGELYSMRLDADLITLSACETGLGKVANGDDVVGLTRGFLYAGSRSIVASLWSVDDKATAELMEAFYSNLAKMPKQQALREAQLRTRQDFPHPFFWAAFQLTGRAD